MKITIFTMGSHGDIRPYVALALELKMRGHAVCIATDRRDEHFCKTFNLDFFPISGDLISNSFLKENLDNELSNKTNRINKLSFFHSIIKALNQMLDQQFEDVLCAAQDADVLIYHPIVFAAPHVAEALNKPSYRLLLQPDERTKEHPISIMPFKLPLGKFGNYISHLFTEQAVWQPVRKSINRWRKERLNIAKINFFGPSSENRFRNQTQLIAVSPWLVPRPSDWKSNIHMTGFCRLEAASTYQSHQSLKQFLGAGEPPLYLGFGSLSSSCPKKVVQDIVNSLSNERVIISGDIPGIKEMELPQHCFILEACPHDWLFPKVAAVIHHGGIGTTAAGLVAGKPTFILPFAVDQFFWGLQIFKKNLGPQALPIKYFDELKFRKAILSLKNNSDYQKNTYALSQKISEEQGARNAANIIERGY